MIFFIILGRGQDAKNTFIGLFAFDVFHSPRCPKLFHVMEWLIVAGIRKYFSGENQIEQFPSFTAHLFFLLLRYLVVIS